MRVPVGDLGVVLSGLEVAEVGSWELGPAVVVVEDQTAGEHGVDIDEVGEGAGRERVEIERILHNVAIVEPVVLSEGVVALDHPDELLDWVIESQLDLAGGGAGLDVLIVGELELVEEVGVVFLGEEGAFEGVQVDEVE